VFELNCIVVGDAVGLGLGVGLTVAVGDGDGDGVGVAQTPPVVVLLSTDVVVVEPV
jgi:hypothetical protein